jgi:tRNA threonylcarbamoyladenosine biosynthesis protein TsaB
VSIRILALETSGRIGSVALLEATGGAATVLEEVTLPAEVRTARSLVPEMDRLLRAHGWAPGDIDLVGTTIGPGSFTGLRIGVVAAKTLAYACGSKLAAVHTLAALAEPVLAERAGTFTRLWTVLDAQRQELFAASFDGAGRTASAACTPATEVIAIDVWLARLAPGDAVFGPPAAKLAPHLPSGVSIVASGGSEPSAAAAGRLAFEAYVRGGCVRPLELVPNYYRRSAAEEKMARGELR